MASLTRWTWVWVNSRRWWWTGRPGVLWVMGSRRVGHNWGTELNWTELKSRFIPTCKKETNVYWSEKDGLNDLEQWFSKRKRRTSSISTFGNLLDYTLLYTSSRSQASSLYPFSYIWKQILGYRFTNLPETLAPIYQILLLNYLSKILSFPFKIPLITQFFSLLWSYLAMGNNHSHNLLSSIYVPYSLPI